MDTNIRTKLYDYFNPNTATNADLQKITAIRVAVRDYYSDLQVVEYRIQQAIQAGVTLDAFVARIFSQTAKAVKAFGTSE